MSISQGVQHLSFYMERLDLMKRRCNTRQFPSTGRTAQSIISIRILCACINTVERDSPTIYGTMTDPAFQSRNQHEHPCFGGGAWVEGAFFSAMLSLRPFFFSSFLFRMKSGVISPETCMYRTCLQILCQSPILDGNYRAQGRDLSMQP